MVRFSANDAILLSKSPVNTLFVPVLFAEIDVTEPKKQKANELHFPLCKIKKSS